MHEIIKIHVKYIVRTLPKMDFASGLAVVTFPEVIFLVIHRKYSKIAF